MKLPRGDHAEGTPTPPCLSGARQARVIERRHGFGLVLSQRRRRWVNIEAMLGWCLVSVAESLTRPQVGCVKK